MFRHSAECWKTLFCGIINFFAHLPAATGLRIRALGRAPTAISLVNVKFVFHHGHHKRHLVWCRRACMLWLCPSSRLCSAWFTVSLPKRSFACRSACFSPSLFPSRGSRKFYAHETLCHARERRIFRSQECVWYWRFFFFLPRISLGSPSTFRQNRRLMNLDATCVAPDVEKYRWMFRWVPSRSAVTATIIAAVESPNLGYCRLENCIHVALFHKCEVCVNVSFFCVLLLIFDCGVSLFRQSVQISRPFVAAVRYRMSTPVWNKRLSPWNGRGNGRTRPLAAVEAGHLRHGLPLIFQCWYTRRCDVLDWIFGGALSSRVGVLESVQVDSLNVSGGSGKSPGREKVTFADLFDYRDGSAVNDGFFKDRESGVFSSKLLINTKAVYYLLIFHI